MNTTNDKNFGRPRKTGANGKAPRSQTAEQAAAEAMAHPGLAARVASAAIIGDIIQGGHTLDEKFASESAPSRLAGLSDAIAASPAPSPRRRCAGSAPSGWR